MLCVRITIEKGGDLLQYYCKMLRDLGDCIIYISEKWVTQHVESILDVQRKLSKAVGFIIYFLHREMRVRKGDAKKLIEATLDGIMSTMFVIVLKKKSKLHEHEPTDNNSATVVTIVLNELFEKAHDKTLVFDRKHIEVFQSKDYKGIANYLSSDQLHDFFEESGPFLVIRKDYCRNSYLDIIAKERLSYARKIKSEQSTQDYQDKTKYKEIMGDITTKSQYVKNREDYNHREAMMWIDHKQRSMKNHLRRIYNNLFNWRGVWRNKELFDRGNAQDFPVKVFNFVTKSLSKPILKNMSTQSLIYYDNEETQKIIKRANVEYKHNNWELLD